MADQPRSVRPSSRQARHLVTRKRATGASCSPDQLGGELSHNLLPAMTPTPRCRLCFAGCDFCLHGCAPCFSKERGAELPQLLSIDRTVQGERGYYPPTPAPLSITSFCRRPHAVLEPSRDAAAASSVAASGGAASCAASGPSPADSSCG
jgi:hypothetical protein